MKEFDVIVIGAGHAGCEAALAAARMECSTLIVTINLDKIALMPCNPAVGGVGKGHLVREIDALGGEMGKNSDATYMQIKTLNSSKGPAVQAPRAQTDKKAYEDRMKKVLLNEKNLFLKQALVTEIIVEGNEARGIKTKSGEKYYGKTTVLTSGTFLRGKIVIGHVEFPAGRAGELPAEELSFNLKRIGLELGRLQTATPPRAHKRSIDFSKMKPQPGDEGETSFSFFATKKKRAQELCYLTYTNRNTHQVVHKFLHLSPIKTGIISEHGPRYCPSIDRKVINFPEKEAHPVFVEPEGFRTEEMYLQGLTTALPPYVQQEIVQTVPGLERAWIMRPGYAVVYDHIKPYQLRPTLETKIIKNLFTAGQINGTTGYEEAAAQGIMAGINAALKAKGKPSFILGRDEAYIGVLLDDLVTKELDEPYRMFTSRAEYRLILRADNADIRLSHYGYKFGLLTEENYKKVREKAQKIGNLINRFKIENVIPAELDEKLVKIGLKPLRAGVKIADLLRRPEINYMLIKNLRSGFKKIEDGIWKQIELEIKYEGYIKRQFEQIERYRKMEEWKIPVDFDFSSLKNVTFEAKEKMNRFRPQSLGQASRIAGVSPADIAVMMIYLKQLQTKDRRPKTGTWHGEKE